MSKIGFICICAAAVGVAAVITHGQTKELPAGSLHPFGPASGTTVTVALVREARITVNPRGVSGGAGVSGELAEVSGSLAYFGDDWISIQSPESGTRMWIPTRHVALITQEAGARPRKQSGE